MNYKRPSGAGGPGYSASTWERIMKDTGHANGGPVRSLTREEIAREYGVPVSRRFGPTVAKDVPGYARGDRGERGERRGYSRAPAAPRTRETARATPLGKTADDALRVAMRLEAATRAEGEARLTACPFVPKPIRFGQKIEARYRGPDRPHGYPGRGGAR